MAGDWWHGIRSVGFVPRPPSRMTTPLRLFAVAGLVLILAAPAGAQPYRPGNNDRLVERAFADMGVEYRGAETRRAVQEAFSELVPGSSWNRYRLNDAQAHAIAFTALGYLGYTWTAQPPGRPRPQRPNPDYYGCQAASTQLYELALYVPTGTSMFLSSEEQARVRAGLTEIGRNANACGCRPLADGALAVLRELSETTMPDRDKSLSDINALRETSERCRAR
jgi:hypothetical protein